MTATHVDAPVQELDLAQGTIRYREVGSGPPIVFVHGLLVHGGLWRNVVPQLEADFRCIVPDWPLGSHGQAMSRRADLTPRGVAAIVGDFLEAAGLEDVTLVGNDTGGAICQLVAVERPERLARLVLLSCDAYEVFFPRMFAYLQWAARVPGALTALMQGMRLPLTRNLPIAYRWLTMRAMPSQLTASFVAPALGDGAVRRDLRRFLRSVSPAVTLEAATRFPEFRAPVLIGWGAQDRFFPFSLAQRLAAAFPDSRLERIEGARTFVGEDQPAQVARLIASFVRERAGVAA